jgi:CheY-like chemotaxis protein
VKSKILAVDDQKVMRQLIQFALARDYEVLEASCGNEALEILEQYESRGVLKQISAVLLDISMPGLGGLEVLQNVHQQYPTLPVLMCTAMSTIDDVRKAVSSGAVDYIVKPFDGVTLRHKLQKALAR